MSPADMLRELVCPTPPKPTLRTTEEVVDCGFRVDASTGEIIGSYFIEPRNAHSWDGEMFVYQREHRFRLLFRHFDIPMCRRAEVLETFLELEAVWEKRKHMFDRIYFVSQKLTAIQICTRLGIPHSVPRFPIRDRKRLRKQLLIFDDLWAHRDNVEPKNGRTIVEHLGGDRVPPQQCGGANPGTTATS